PSLRKASRNEVLAPALVSRAASGSILGCLAISARRAASVVSTVKPSVWTLSAPAPSIPTINTAKSNFMGDSRLFQRLQLSIAVPGLRMGCRRFALRFDRSRVDRPGRVADVAPYVADHRGNLRIVQLVLEGGHLAVIVRAVHRQVARDTMQDNLHGQRGLAIDPLGPRQRGEYTGQALSAGLVAGQALGGIYLGAVD